MIDPTQFDAEAPTRPSKDDIVDAPTRAQHGLTPHVSRPDAEGELSPGTLLGRYIVLAKLGAGGMSFVYSAFDPELDRKVAIKLLRPDKGGELDGGQARLLREAQALARLGHPNVVGVFDVGIHGVHIWVAMEFIDGETLREFVSERRPAWTELLRIMRDTAAGLAAAHAAGLVHRDLKPDNIMIARGGRVRVMDFGLVRATDGEGLTHDARAPAYDPLTSQVLTPTHAALPALLTVRGSILGTPAYMAPEQWDGRKVDARTDIFALCLTFWELACGTRPFTAERSEREAQIRRGPLAPPAEVKHAPAWFFPVLARGLHADPDQRPPSISALLDALVAAEARPRRRRRVAFAAAVLALTAAVLGLLRNEHHLERAACQAEGATIAAAWDPEASTALRDLLAATTAPGAAKAAELALPWVERWTAEWSRGRERLCVDTLDDVFPEHLRERAVDCFNERRDTLSALRVVLLADGALASQWAVPAFSGLAAIEPCLDPLALSLRPAPPASQSVLPMKRALHDELTQVEALRLTGRVQEATAAAEQVLRAASTTGDRGLMLSAQAALAQLAHEAGRDAAAEELYSQVFREALRLGATELAVTAALSQSDVLGVRRGRSGEGLVWVEVAEAMLPDRGAAPSLFAVRIAHNRGLIELERGALEAAEAHLRRALAIWHEIAGPDHPRLAHTLDALAEVLSGADDLDGALLHFQRARELRESTLGPEHPLLAASLQNVATIHGIRGQLELAEPLFLRALEIQTATHGPESPELLGTLRNLANVARGRGELQREMDLRLRHLAITSRVFSADHPQRIKSQTDVARALEQRDDLAGALALLEYAADPSAPRTGNFTFALATRGRLLRRQGRLEEAIADLERARSQEQAPDFTAIELARARFARAQELWDAPPGRRDRERARRLAEDAEAAYALVEAPPEDERAAVVDWRQRAR
jgi:tetratricopeptide (TPR) repeat protein